MIATALPASANNSSWHQFTTWFTTRSSWTGSNGAVALLGQHVKIAGLSLLVAALLGIPLAVVLARWRRGGVVVTSLANGARAIPIVGVMVLLAVGPLGVSTKSAVVALVIFAIPPLLTNAFTGIRGVDREVIDAAVGMGLTRGQITRRIELPLALPLIANGLRLAAVQVWATATIAAIIGSGGFGSLVTAGFATENFGEIYFGVLLVVVTVLLIDGGLAVVQRRIGRRYGELSVT